MARAPHTLGFAALLAALVLSGCATTPRVWTEPPVMSAEAREAHNLRVFDRAVARVEGRFFDVKLRGVDWPSARARHREAARQATTDEELYTALNTLLSELGESHTGALPPRDAFQERNGTRVATGFMMRRIEGRWVIQRVYPGSAAEEAGVQAGWVVLSRDGQPIPPLGQRFPMTPGQEIQFEFLDADDVVREMALLAGPVVWAPRRESRLLDDGTLYVGFERFDIATIRWLGKELETHRTAPAAIIDLRNNPGGLLMSARLAIAQFFPRRVEIGTFIQRSGREHDTGSLTWGSARFQGPVAIIVNEASASSSEIFSHVLQHHDRAVVVGRKTAGAVIAALDYRLPDGGLLQVAISDYVGLDGKRLEGRGVTPDVTVPVTLSDLRRGRDAELEAARAALRKAAPDRAADAGGSGNPKTQFAKSQRTARLRRKGCGRPVRGPGLQPGGVFASDEFPHAVGRVPSRGVLGRTGARSGDRAYSADGWPASRDPNGFWDTVGRVPSRGVLGRTGARSEGYSNPPYTIHHPRSTIHSLPTTRDSRVK